MSGRIGIDFGTSNSVVAVFDERAGGAESFPIPDLGVIKWSGADDMHIIPSLIHYGDGATWVGAQVLTRNLYDHPSTFRWMKRFIAHRSDIPRQLAGRLISPSEAGREFLWLLVQSAQSELGDLDEEIGFAAPVESFEHYDEWLRGVADQAGIRRFRLIDEASAAALGYGAPIQPGDVYLVFDFGGGTLDVAVVMIEEQDGAAAGRRCRVLGKAGVEIGGSTLDGWLFSEVLRRNGRRDSDEDVRAMSRELLVSCEAAKEQLSTATSAEVSAQDPQTGRVLLAELTRPDFEELLDQHEMYSRIDRTVRAAIARAREKGFDDDAIKQVMLVGGSSLIPSVQSTVKRIFGRDRVALARPLDAVARGTAAFVAGVDFFDHIQHDYAIRHVNQHRNEYEYRRLVEAGTPYPTEQALATLTVKASYDGQQQLGLAIFELAAPFQPASDQPVELVFDPSGAARLVELTVDEQHARTHFWMNEDSPTFLEAQPPARKGEGRFQVSFHIDDSKRLLVSARDLKTGRWLYDRYPVVKLA
jgi:molecular chaperone DnaK (HSP70)